MSIRNGKYGGKKKQFLPFLKSSESSEQNVAGTNCTAIVQRELLEGSHTSVTSVRVCASSDGIAIGAIQNIRPLAPRSTSLSACTLLMNVIASSLEHHTQKFD